MSDAGDSAGTDPDEVAEDDQPQGEPFLRAVLRGKRFDGGRVPLALLTDLTALNELLVSLARHRFLDEQTTRKRLPKGYLDSTSLWLVSVEDGSAVLLLERNAATLPTDVQADPFEEARELFVRTVKDVSEGRDVPPDFPHNLRRRFNAIGRHLADDETLDIGSPATASPARYTRAVRARLVEQAEGVEDDYFAVGMLEAFSGPARTFRIRTPDGPIEGSFVDEIDPDLRDGIAHAEATSTYLNGSLPYRVDGTATMVGDDLRAFVAESVTPVDFLFGNVEFAEAARRVAELVALGSGWMDGEGVAINSAGAERFLHVLAGLADFEQACPAIFPTLDGGLRAEWEISERYELVWEFDDGGGHFVQSRRLGTREFESYEFDASLNAADVAERLSGILDDLLQRRSDTGG